MSGIEAEIREGIKEAVKKEIKAEIAAEAKAEIKAEIKADVKEGLGTEKKLLRRAVLKKVETLSDAYCVAADAGILRQVMEMPEYQTARTVFCYVGTAREINTRPILERILADSKQLAVPLCVGKGIMKACALRDLRLLQPGMMDIPEPPADCAEIPPEMLDLVLVPCVSCTARGERLGYGGGFYDRYLVRTEAFRAILVRQELMEERVPVEAHDLLMDAVITEVGRIDCREEREHGKQI